MIFCIQLFTCISEGAALMVAREETHLTTESIFLVILEMLWSKILAVANIIMLSYFIEGL